VSLKTKEIKKKKSLSINDDFERDKVKKKKANGLNEKVNIFFNDLC
jgi:hypothetical protein